MEIMTIVILGILGGAALLYRKTSAAGVLPETDPGTPAVSGKIVRSPNAIQTIIREAALNHGQDPALMLALAQVESSMDPAAVNASDPSYGLFQIQLFWPKHFGYSVPVAGSQAALDPAENLLLDPTQAADIAGQILEYFQARQNPTSGDMFKFPADIDVYNVGETLWAKGRRNLAYRDKVLAAYRSFGGSQ